MRRYYYLFSIKHVQFLNILLSLIALVFGGIIYLVFRPGEFVFFQWIREIGLGSWLNFLKNQIPTTHLPRWLLYSLPDGLWAFAYSLLIFSIGHKSNSTLKYVWFLSIPLLVFGFEFLQYFELINGTFSVPDLFAGLAGILAEITIAQLINKTYRYENNKN